MGDRNSLEPPLRRLDFKFPELVLRLRVYEGPPQSGGSIAPGSARGGGTGMGFMELPEFVRIREDEAMGAWARELEASAWTRELEPTGPDVREVD